MAVAARPDLARLSRARVDLRQPIWAVAVGLVLVLNVYPVVWLVWGSVQAPEGGITVRNYADLVTNLGTLEAVWNSMVLAVSSVALALLLGTMLAIGVARTDMPLKGLIRAATVISFVGPAWVAAMAYSFLLSPNAGLVNVALSQLIGTKPFSVYGMAGMIFVTTLHLYPYVFLILVGALENIDASFEEASTITGARKFTTIGRVTLPLIRPYLATAIVFSFINVWGEFAIPAILGVPERVYVFSTYLYLLLNAFPPKLGLSAAIAIFFIVVAGVLVSVVLQRAADTRSPERYYVLGGKGGRAVQMRIGAWKYVFLAIGLLATLLGLVLPYIVVLGLSLSERPLAGFSFQALTLQHYANFLSSSDFVPLLRNTLVLGVAMALGNVAIGLVVSYIVVRSRVRGRRLIHFAATFPIVVPAVAFVVGIIWAWIRSPIVLYGTLWILLVAQLARFMPISVQNLGDGMRQIDASLEQAAATCGARWTRLFRTIYLPLLRPVGVSTFLLLLMASLRDLLTPLFLGTGTAVTATLGSRAYQAWGEASVAEGATASILLVFLMFGLYLPAARLLRGHSGGQS